MLWYWCTRHTFASQWVMGRGTIEKLKEILGHYSVVVTERYAHLRPGHFSDGARATLAVDLSPGKAEVTRLDDHVTAEGRSSTGQWMASDAAAVAVKPGK